MTCPDDRTLSLHLDGVLDASASRALEDHALQCTACRERIRTLRALEDLLAEPEPLPSGMLQRALVVTESRPSWPRPVRGMAGAALAVVLVFLLARVWDARPTGDGRSTRPVDATAAVVPALDFSGQVRAALVDPAPAAIRFLDEVGDRALGVLHRVALDRDRAAARAAVVRLGALARRESLPVLLEALAYGDRRECAIEALGRLGDARALAALEPWLDDPILGHLTLDAAVRIGGRRAVAVLAVRVDRPNGILDPDALVAAMGRVDGAVGARALARLLDGGEHAAAALAALRANEPTLRPHLQVDATGPNATRATRALAALECLASPDSVPVLVRLLDTRARRAEAARILARIDTEDAAAALVAAADRPTVRDAFRRAGPRVEAYLLAQLARGSRRERVRCIDLVGLCGRAASVTRLETWTTDPSLAPHVVTALGRIGGDAAAGALARLADRPALRRPAVEALGWTGAPRAVGLLLDLGRGDPSLRDPVFRALSRLGSPDAVSAILRLDVRHGTGGRAVRALQGMELDIVVPTLLSLLDGDRDGAGDARRALAALGHRVPRGRAH